MEFLEKFSRKDVSRKDLLPADYTGYSDAKQAQYVISGVKFEDLYKTGVTV